MPENPEPWQIVLLILPIAILMLIIKYRERNALTTPVESLTGPQKAWLVVSALPPEQSAGVLACCSAEELQAMVRGASLIPATTYRLVEQCFNELAESLPSEQFRLKVNGKTTLESSDFLNPRTIPWFAATIRTKWLGGTAAECRMEMEAPEIAPLVVEMNEKSGTLWLARCGQTAELRSRLMTEAGILLPSTAVEVNMSLPDGVVRVSYDGGGSVITETGAAGPDGVWDMTCRAVIECLKGLGPDLITTEYASLLLREVGRYRPLLAATLTARYPLSRIRDHLRNELSRGQTLKNTDELLERLLAEKSKEPDPSKV